MFGYLSFCLNKIAIFFPILFVCFLFSFSFDWEDVLNIIVRV